jgi:polyisoprenoid-binding protein YceI
MTITTAAPLPVDLSAESTWTIDASHTNVEFAAKHLMITTVKGRLATLSGEISLNGSHPERSSVAVNFDVASLDTRSQQRDDHLRSADFLDVARFPSINFRSTRVAGLELEPGHRFELTGLLTIRDVTREVSLDAVFEGSGKDPWGGERLSFSASTAIDRRDFGLTWNTAMESGGFLVGNDVRIQLEVQAVRNVVAPEAGVTASAQD